MLFVPSAFSLFQHTHIFAMTFDQRSNLRMVQWYVSILLVCIRCCISNNIKTLLHIYDHCSMMYRYLFYFFLYIHKLFVLCNYCNRDRFIHIHVSPSSCYRFNCPNPSFYTSLIFSISLKFAHSSSAPLIFIRRRTYSAHHNRPSPRSYCRHYLLWGGPYSTSLRFNTKKYLSHIQFLLLLK